MILVPKPTPRTIGDRIYQYRGAGWASSLGSSTSASRYHWRIGDFAYKSLGFQIVLRKVV